MGVRSGISTPNINARRRLFITPKQPGFWPEPFTYNVNEIWPEDIRDDGVAVIVPGIPELTTQRVLGADPHSTIGVFTSDARMQLLHSILGDSIKMRDMKLPDAETVPFPTDLTYQMAVQQAVVKREQEFQALSKELVAKGLMTAEEVQSVWPTLQVKVVDMRETKTPPLPEIKLPPGLNKVVVISAGE